MEQYEVDAVIAKVKELGFEHGRADVEQDTSTHQQVGEKFLETLSLLVNTHVNAQALMNIYCEGVGLGHDSFCYLVAKRSQADAYLGFGSHVITNGPAYRAHPPYWCIIRAPKEHALWQGERLASGMALFAGPTCGFTTEYAAKQAAELMMAALNPYGA